MIFKWLRKKRFEAEYKERQRDYYNEMVRKRREARIYFKKLKDPEELKRDVINGKFEEMAFKTDITAGIITEPFLHMEESIVYEAIKRTLVDKKWVLPRCLYLVEYIENLKKSRKEKADKLRAIRRGELL